MEIPIFQSQRNKNLNKSTEQPGLNWRNSGKVFWYTKSSQLRISKKINQSSKRMHTWVIWGVSSTKLFFAIKCNYMHIWHMHHHHMHVAIGVEDYDLAMSKHVFFFNTVNEQNSISLAITETYSAREIGLCPEEGSWYFSIFIHIQ